MFLWFTTPRKSTSIFYLEFCPLKLPDPHNNSAVGFALSSLLFHHFRKKGRLPLYIQIIIHGKYSIAERNFQGDFRNICHLCRFFPSLDIYIYIFAKYTLFPCFLCVFPIIFNFYCAKCTLHLWLLWAPPPAIGDPGKNQRFCHLFCVKGGVSFGSVKTLSPT